MNIYYIYLCQEKKKEMLLYIMSDSKSIYMKFLDNTISLQESNINTTLYIYSNGDKQNCNYYT